MKSINKKGDKIKKTVLSEITKPVLIQKSKKNCKKTTYKNTYNGESCLFIKNI